MTRIYSSFLALLAGAILPLAFAPWGFWIIAPLSAAILLSVWLKGTPWQTAWHGFLFGMGCYGVGTSWVFVSIHRYGGQGILSSLFFTLLLTIVLASLFAAQGYAFTRFFPKENKTKILLAFPSLWVIFEWIRGWLLTGFPWLLLGYSQTDSWLSGYAPVLSVYGISFLVLLTAGFIHLLLTTPKVRTRLYILCFIAIIWGGGYLLQKVEWTHPFSQPIQVSLIQGNVKQKTAYSLQDAEQILAQYKKLTNTVWSSQIIIWPEAAVPAPLRLMDNQLFPLAQKARKKNSTLIIGIPMFAFQNDFYNAAITLGNGAGVYYKRHLVPFGEYVPFASLLNPVFKTLHAPISMLVPGLPIQHTLHIGKLRIAPFICYEIAYAELLRSDLPRAHLLVTMTNDAWFGNSWAAAQQLQIAKLRAIETGRYMLYSSNNGITAVINAKGKITKTIPRFKTDILTTTATPMEGTTPWVLYGTSPLLILLGLFLIAATVAQLKIN